MTMKEMRSAVCKRANELIKSGYYCKSNAFKKAWAEIKLAARSIKTSDLTAGDVIRIEYGMDGNFVTCTVTEVSKKLFLGKYFIVKAISTNYGNEIEFTAKPEDLIEKAA